MPKVKVTYRAPQGDSKVNEAFGHTFYDGKPEEIEVSDEVLRKISGNPIFEVGDGPHSKSGPKKGDYEKDETKAKS